MALTETKSGFGSLLMRTGKQRVATDYRGDDSTILGNRQKEEWPVGRH